MEFDNDMLAPFVGGEFEVENREGGAHYRGAIKAIHIKRAGGVTLTAELEWCAKEEGFPRHTGTWRVHNQLTHFITTNAYTITSDVGQLLFTPTNTRGDWIVLRPKGQALLDRSAVLG